ncbi:hypothetical protein [Streptomyces lasiicapitis]|uniref:hypothetical protein n=1 Tax=Streptomyces lasiicapitis TaxID=1923961 RepID=UPI00166A3E49|nr:hypothetical protein [Streptomyces lasiicapitis]
MIGGLRDNHALYDARSGHRWDLYVAGYYAYGEREYDPQGIPLHVDVGDEPTGWDYRYAQANWWFSPREFVGPASAVASAHADCLARVPMLRGRRTPWKYSGHPELVNVWVSGRTPDWESLIAREVGEQGPSALSAIVESHAGWPTIRCRASTSRAPARGRRRRRCAPTRCAGGCPGRSRAPPEERCRRGRRSSSRR